MLLQTSVSFHENRAPELYLLGGCNSDILESNLGNVKRLIANGSAETWRKPSFWLCKMSLDTKMIEQEFKTEQQNRSWQCGTCSGPGGEKMF